MTGKIKTLQDLLNKNDGGNNTYPPYIFEHVLKHEIIKWIKNDRSILRLINPEHYSVFDRLTKLWMKRFNITEGDLI